MRCKLEHVHSVRKRLADGRVAVYHYHRRTRKRIHGEPGTPEFLASYVEAGKVNRAEKIWSDADIAKFETVASAELILALRLALDTGQRQGDLLRLPWSAFDVDVL